MTTEDTTPETDALDDVTHQPMLPTLELPEYHGRKPVKMKTAIAGAGSRITRPHSIGDRIVLIAEVRVKSAGHEDTDDGLEYVERYKVLDLFELDKDQGARLISTVRSLYRTADDAVKGRRPVPGLGEVGYTDASGVVLTPSEVAELRGDPVRAILSPELTPAVVVYEDGNRDLWPDDYPKDAPRPNIGERYLTDSGEVEVLQLLHHQTGEPIETAATPAVPDLPEPEPELPEPESDPLASALAAAGVSNALAALVAEEPDQADLVAAIGGTTPAEEADPYAGELGDDVEGWEPATPPRPLTTEEAETERILAAVPAAPDFAFVDCQIPELISKLAGVTDLAQAKRLELAEKHGRGRGLKPRGGALSALGKRVAELAASTSIGGHQ